MKRLIENHWYRINDRGDEYVAQYTGNDQGFDCCVCGKGCKAHTFNLWYGTDHAADYETWGFGPKHLPKILADLGQDGKVYLRNGKEVEV